MRRYVKVCVFCHMMYSTNVDFLASIIVRKMISWKIKGLCRCAAFQQVRIGSPFSRMISNTAHKTIILCPGQSSQYIGMIRNDGLSEKMKDMVDTAKRILGYDIVKICEHGPEELLSRC